MIFLRLGEVQFRKDASDVLLDGSLGAPQSPGDPRVRAALGDEREHVALAITERVQLVSAPTNGDESLHYPSAPGTRCAGLSNGG